MHIYKRIRCIFYICVFVNNILFTLNLFTMDSENKIIKVYSHGFGELGNKKEGPCYSNSLSNTSFYTKPAVHQLANYLKKKIVDKEYKGIILEGRSSGAGTILNLLYHLYHYDERYFADTKIKSQEDSQKILDVINRVGVIILDTPLLSLKKVNNVSLVGSIVVWAGLVSMLNVIYYMCFSLEERLEKSHWEFFQLSTVFLALIGVFCSEIKNIGTTAIDTLLIPLVTTGYYNPFHIKPIDAIQGLKKKLKCPVLIHFCKQDGCIANPDEDTIKLYEAFMDNNKTYILLSDDAHHDKFSYQYDGLKQVFSNKYVHYTKDIAGDVDMRCLKKAQPTVEKLRKKINATKFCW